MGESIYALFSPLCAPSPQAPRSACPGAVSTVGPIGFHRTATLGGQATWRAHHRWSGSVQVPGPWHAGRLVPVPILVFMPTLAYPNSSSPSPSRHEVIEADGVGFGMQHGTKQGEWQDEDCRRSLSCTQLALHSSNRHLANRLTRWDVRALPYPAPRVGWAGPPLLHTAGWVGISF